MIFNNGCHNYYEGYQWYKAREVYIIGIMNDISLGPIEELVSNLPEKLSFHKKLAHFTLLKK